MANTNKLNDIEALTRVSLTSSELLTSSPPRVTVSRVTTVFFPSAPILVSVTTHLVTDRCEVSIMREGGSSELNKNTKTLEKSKRKKLYIF